MRKLKKLTQDDVAEAIGVKRSTYADYENAKSEPVVSLLMKLAALFEVGVTDLLLVDLGAPLFRNKVQPGGLTQDDLRVVAITVDKSQQENIEFVAVTAFAGYAAAFKQPEYIESLPRFTLPNLREGTHRAFEVRGDSMPPIHNGYVLIGRYVENCNDLKTDKRFVLITRDTGIVFKKVINEVSKHKRLMLVSDNPEYHPFPVDISDVLEAWEMVAFIGYPNIYQDKDYQLHDRLQRVEYKLDSMNEVISKKRSNTRNRRKDI